jgi:hypothetical protein
MDLGEDLISLVCLVLNAIALVRCVKLENLDTMNGGWLGVFIAPTTKLVVWWRLLSHGAPDSPVRLPRHQTVGFRRWSFCLLGHRTVRWCTRKALFSVRCAIWLCSDSGVHCSAFNAFCRRPLARSSRCSTGTPDSPVLHRTVRWIIAERPPEFPKVSSSELESLVHRTLSSGTPDSPVRQTRAHFGWL